MDVSRIAWESPKRTVTPRLRVCGIPETINGSREIDVRPDSGPEVNRQLAEPRVTLQSAGSLEEWTDIPVGSSRVPT